MLNQVHTMKAQVGVEVELHTLLASVLDRGKWLASYPSYITPREIARYPAPTKISVQCIMVYLFAVHFDYNKSISLCHW
jgi:hypothetical protein